MYILQVVAVDVPIHSHLGVCLAVRVPEAVALLNSHTIPSEGSDCERAKYSSYEIEHTILHCANCSSGSCRGKQIIHELSHTFYFKKVMPLTAAMSHKLLD